MKKIMDRWFRINVRVVVLTILLLVLVDVALTRAILPYYLRTDDTAVRNGSSTGAVVVRRLPAEDPDSLNLWKEDLVEQDGRKVVFLGDSVVYGSGVPEEGQTIPSYFASYIQMLLPDEDIKVYSFSLKGCTPVDATRILEYVVDARPDLVIYDINIGWFASQTETGHQQLTQLSSAEPIRQDVSADQQNQSGNERIENVLGQVVNEYWSLYRYRIFLNYLLFGEPIRDILMAEGKIAEKTTMEEELFQEDQFKPWYEKDFSFLKANSGKLGLCTLDASNPHWNYYNQFMETLHSNQINAVFFTVPRNRTLYLKYGLLDEKVFAFKQNQLIDVARRNGITTYDFTFSVKDDYFTDTIHMTKEGNQAVAKMLVWNIIESDFFKRGI